MEKLEMLKKAFFDTELEKKIFNFNTTILEFSSEKIIFKIYNEEGNFKKIEIKISSLKLEIEITVDTLIIKDYLHIDFKREISELIEINAEEISGFILEVKIRN